MINKLIRKKLFLFGYNVVEFIFQIRFVYKIITKFKTHFSITQIFFNILIKSVLLKKKNTIKYNLLNYLI